MIFISIITVLNFTGFVLSEVPQNLDTAWKEVCVSSKVFLTCTFLFVIKGFEYNVLGSDGISFFVLYLFYVVAM